MSLAHTVLLGGLAGFTIYLGLPVGRLPLLSSRALLMISLGFLAGVLTDLIVTYGGA